MTLKKYFEDLLMQNGPKIFCESITLHIAQLFLKS